MVMHSTIWVVRVHFQRSRVGFCDEKAGEYAIWMPVATISLYNVSH